MFGKNRNERNSQDRFANRERYGEERDEALERDLQRSTGQRFTSDDRTYALNDRSGDRYIGSRGYEGYEDYPGAREGRKDFGARAGSRGSSAGEYRGNREENHRDDSRESNSYRGEFSNDPYARNSFIGQPGLSSTGPLGRESFGRHSSPTGQGYRAYQDYGSSVGTSYDSSYDESSTRDRRHFGKGPKGYKRSDEKIHDEVCEILTSHYDIDASEVEVEVKDGVVTLGGAVESRRTKRMAEDIVADLNGVQDVRNDMRILSHDSRLLEMSSDSKSATNHRSAATSTDSTLANKTGKSSSASSSHSTASRQ